MRIQILGKHIKYPRTDPWKFKIDQLIKTKHSNIVIVQKHLKQTTDSTPGQSKTLNNYQRNVEYMSTREHHNAQCQLHTKEKEAK